MSSKDVIKVVCKSCKNSLRFSADKAGKRAKCSKCGEIVTIPSAPEEIPKDPTPPPEEMPAGNRPPNAEEIGDYGVGDAIEQAELPNQAGEREPKNKKEKKVKVRRKVKALENIEEWQKVRIGLMVIFFSVCIWGLSHFLHGSFVLLGSADIPFYSVLMTEEQQLHQPPANPDDFWDVDQFKLLLGMISGSTYLGYAKICMVVCSFLTFLQLVVAAVGYGFCLPIPERFGTKLQVFLLLGLVGVNLLLFVFLQLLPVLGMYQYYLIPLVFPEVVMTDYNIERALPIHILWMASPFWEMLLTLFTEFLGVLEPTVGAILLWSIGQSIKEERLINAGHTLTHLCLGQFFLLIAFHIFSVNGCSSVLINVLRIIYTLWYFFLLLFIIRYSSVLLKARELIELKLHPANEVTE